MKELSIEEKAKAYDEAIKKLKVLHDDWATTQNRAAKEVEEIFPELKESEDERIRNGLIGYFRAGKCENVSSYHGISTNDILAWLEKQGEHANFRNKIQIGDKVTRNEDGMLVNLSQLKRVAKPADKVESKFKVGDWVVYDGWTTQIKKVYEDGYSNTHRGFIPIKREEEMRLWTIQDAKDGDVLVTKAGGIFIYKELLYDKPFAYCGVDKFGVFKDCNCGDGLDWTPYLSDVTPATKEQREKLEKAMNDAGYIFDFEKKELKKIKQNPAWSEEDDYNLQCMIAKVTFDIHKGNVGRNQELIDWLKSLKDRYTWKPSEEQMEALWGVTEKHLESDNTYTVELIGKVLESLYHDLKKLREE